MKRTAARPSSTARQSTRLLRLLRRTAAQPLPVTPKAPTCTHPRAAGFLELLGGADNITTVNNCATRLRVSVADESLVSTSDAEFKSAGALGIVRKGKAFQVIVGMDVPQVRERFETMVNSSKSNV